MFLRVIEGNRHGKTLLLICNTCFVAWHFPFDNMYNEIQNVWSHLKIWDSKSNFNFAELLNFSSYLNISSVFGFYKTRAIVKIPSNII